MKKDALSSKLRIDSPFWHSNADDSPIKFAMLTWWTIRIFRAVIQVCLHAKFTSFFQTGPQSTNSLVAELIYLKTKEGRVAFELATRKGAGGVEGGCKSKLSVNVAFYFMSIHFTQIIFSKGIIYNR